MFFLSAFLPMVAILEVVVVFITSKFKISRTKAFMSVSFFMLIAAIPSALSPLEGGFLYNLDIFIGAIGSVIGSIIALFAFGWVMSKKDAITTINLNSRFKLGTKWYIFTKYITPFSMLLVILYALGDVIIGYFPLDGIPASNYILFPALLSFIPAAAVSLAILIIGTYYLDKKRLHKI